AELRVVIQVPARELAGRNAARRRIKQAEHALGERMPPLEDGVMHDLVQEHSEIEDREPLDERQRDPDERVIEADERPRPDPQDRELTRRDNEVAQWLLPVQIPHLLARDGRAQLSTESSRVLRVVVGLHGLSIVSRLTAESAA